MVDKAIGTGGTMRITDTGTYVEFWINSNNSTTFVHELPWGYTVNGVTDNSNEYDYNAGAGWERLGRWLVTTDQTVTFRLFDSGTGRFGSGDSLSMAIERATVPPAPTIVSLTPGPTTIAVNMDSNGSGGATVDQWQFLWSTNTTIDSGDPYIFLSLSNGTGTGTGLTPGTTYYCWARGHNAKGWGAWSSRKTFTTPNVPPAPSSVVISDIKQASAKTTFTGNGDGGSPILEWQLGYGTNATTPQTLVPSTGVLALTGLDAGMKYYFWARGRNAVGWGPWSVVSTATLLAGAWVDVAGVKKRAVPYVRTGGVWKVAEPYAKIAGLWKVTG